MPGAADWMRGIGHALQSGVNTGVMLRTMSEKERAIKVQEATLWFKAKTERYNAQSERMRVDIDKTRSAWQKDQGNKALLLRLKEMELKELTLTADYWHNLKTLSQTYDMHVDNKKLSQQQMLVQMRGQDKQSHTQERMGKLQKEIAKLKTEEGIITAVIGAQAGMSRTELSVRPFTGEGTAPGTIPKIINRFQGGLRGSLKAGFERIGKEAPEGIVPPDVPVPGGSPTPTITPPKSPPIQNPGSLGGPAQTTPPPQITPTQMQSVEEQIKALQEFQVLRGKIISNTITPQERQKFAELTVALRGIGMIK